MKHFRIIIEGDIDDDVPELWVHAMAAAAEVQVAEPEIWVAADPDNPTSIEVTNLTTKVEFP